MRATTSSIVWLAEHQKIRRGIQKIKQTPSLSLCLSLLSSVTRSCNATRLALSATSPRFRALEICSEVSQLRSSQILVIEARLPPLLAERTSYFATTGQDKLGTKAESLDAFSIQLRQ